MSDQTRKDIHSLRWLAGGDNFDEGTKQVLWRAADGLDRLSGGGGEVEGWKLVPVVEHDKLYNAARILCEKTDPSEALRGELRLAGLEYLRALVAAPPAPATDDWQCPECQCRSHARVDEPDGKGHYRPGPEIRCVNCKRVFTYPAPPEPVNDQLVKALEEIAKGEGAFSMDPLEHASNCIDSMKDIANKALAAAPPASKTDAEQPLANKQTASIILSDLAASENTWDIIGLLRASAKGDIQNWRKTGVSFSARVEDRFTWQAADILEILCRSLGAKPSPPPRPRSRHDQKT